MFCKKKHGILQTVQCFFCRRWRELCANRREKATPPDIIDLLRQHGAASSVYFAKRLSWLGKCTATFWVLLQWPEITEVRSHKITWLSHSWWLVVFSGMILVEIGWITDFWGEIMKHARSSKKLGNTEGLAWFKWDGLLRFCVKRSEYASEHLVLNKLLPKIHQKHFFAF